MSEIVEADVIIELHTWLAENWDPDLTVAEWWQRLGLAGWFAPTWPIEWFGKGVSRDEANAISREIASFGALGAPAGLGLLLAGPTIVTHGTDEQRQRLLPPIVTGQVAWCQLFSEPGAGSDLAGLQAKGVKDGDEWIVNGQKVWTSGAQWADVGMLLARNGDPAHDHAIARARDWIVGMQSGDGGWGAFEPENTHSYLNHIPFADHGALLDPPTADVTGRCVGFLAQIGMPADDPVMASAIAYLRREQEKDGSWFGRWGTNYIYGTWSVINALNVAGLPPEDPAMSRAVSWLVSVQREDGGWGEDEESYADAPRGRFTESTPSQTAWAILALMGAGQADHLATARGIAWLAATQKPDGEWDEAPYTAVGFPKVFYLKYHGYRLFFPLLALSRYRNLQRGNQRRVDWGI